MQDMFSDAMEQLLKDRCAPSRIRRIEESGSAEELWREVLASGFADALVPEAGGGAGLSLAEVFPIVFVSGRHALPLPFAQTMAVRGVCGATSMPCPDGAIAIASEVDRQADGAILCHRVPFGRVSSWVLANLGTTAVLLPAETAQSSLAGGRGSLDASLRWERIPEDAPRLTGNHDWRAISACLIAGLLAGALERVFEMSVGYANERTQFGKPIAKFQAIQQQISVMAEQVFASKMAAQIGFGSATHLPAVSSAAVAKLRTSEAVVSVSAIAHAVHGAMGFTEEYDLQLYTRRLHEWRLSYGSEAHWGSVLGSEVAGTQGLRAIDFVRERIPAWCV